MGKLIDISRYESEVGHGDKEVLAGVVATVVTRQMYEPRSHLLGNAVELAFSYRGCLQSCQERTPSAWHSHFVFLSYVFLLALHISPSLLSKGFLGPKELLLGSSFSTGMQAYLRFTYHSLLISMIANHDFETFCDRIFAREPLRVVQLPFSDDTCW